jgi:hypothetical protein
MPLMRRRPLLRAAAVGGGAYVAGKRAADRRAAGEMQEQRISDLEAQSYAAPPPAPAPAYAAPPPPPPPAPAAGGIQADALDKLKELAALHEQGVLTDQEFADQKARLLGT